MLVHLDAHLVERRCEHRKVSIQLPAHPHPLRTLTRKQKRERRQTAVGHAFDHTLSLSAQRQCPEMLPQLLPVPAEHHCPILQRRSPSEREADICSIQIGGARNKARQSPGLLTQRIPTPPRYNPRHRIASDRPSLGGRLSLPKLRFAPPKRRFGPRRR